MPQTYYAFISPKKSIVSADPADVVRAVQSHDYGMCDAFAFLLDGTTQDAARAVERMILERAGTADRSASSIC